MKLSYSLAAALATASILYSPQTLSERASPQPEIIWIGPTTDETLNHIRTIQDRLIRVNSTSNGTSKPQHIYIRPSSFRNSVEILNNKYGIWVTLWRKNNGQFLNPREFVEKIDKSASCDLVQTKIILTNSTAGSEIHFNEKPIGAVKANGRFNYTSKGVCKDEKIEVLATHRRCHEMTKPFFPTENPHIFKETFQLLCNSRGKGATHHFPSLEK